MANLSGYGISVALPARFEGRIFRRAEAAGAASYPVVHLSTFAVPATAGDFGGGATALMKSTDIFSVLFEYGPESIGRALFARQGMPRALNAAHFKPYLLRQGVGNQSGTQWFFTDAGRPFTLFVVLGNHALASQLLPEVNSLLGALPIEPGGAP